MNWSEQYTNGRDYTWFTTQALSELLDAIDYRYNEDARLTALDIGCGTGQLARDLYHRGYKVTGVDTSETAITLATQSTHYQDVKFEIYDIGNGSLSEKFDLITCKYVLAFMEDKEAFFDNVTKMLRNNNSHFALISPNPEHTPVEKLSITLDSEEITSLIKRFFNTVSVQNKRGDVWYICSNVII